MLDRILLWWLPFFLAGVFGGDLVVASAKETIVIAIQPTSTPENLSAQAEELKQYLSQRMNRDVEIFFPTSYAGVIEALRFGHADAAFMGSWPAVLAMNRANAEIILAEVREVFINGERTEAPHYFSYWVVLPGSPYQDINDLKGKRVAFSSRLSSSGYVAPMSRLVDLGLITPSGNKPADAADFFGAVRFAGGYGQGWEALKSGQVDATIIAGDVPESLYQEVLAKTRIIETQGPIPSHAVLVASGMSPALRDELSAAFMGLNEERYRPLMRKFVSGIFVRFTIATPDHVASFKRMVETVGLEFMESP
jgi:phosphonate transport system substrate-binding protein